MHTNLYYRLLLINYETKKALNGVIKRIENMFQHSDLYEVSKDYQRLYKLIQKGFRVVCFVDYTKGAKYRDVAFYRGKTKYSLCWELIGRGISYTQFDPEIDTQNDFIQDCERINLEFIDRNG
ncbi:MAG: hypothetical protein GY870_19360 [archaeon]|nr:hypothetical protein [archaeon]